MRDGRQERKHEGERKAKQRLSSNRKAVERAGNGWLTSKDCKNDKVDMGRGGPIWNEDTNWNNALV